MDRLLWIAVCCGCSAHLGEIAETAPDDAATNLGPWSTPTPIPGADDPVNSEDDCTLDSAATELIFALQVPMVGKGLYVMTRQTTNDPWTAPSALTVLNTAGSEESPRLSTDDLTLYFGRGGSIYSSTRTAVGAPWATAALVSNISIAGDYQKWLAVCDGGNVMVSRDIGDGNGQDLYEGTLADGANTADDVLNSASGEISTFLSTDCLTVYFASNRTGKTQIYTATRTAVGTSWTTPTMVGSPFSDGSDDEDPWISIDQRTFVFAGIRAPATTKDLYISTR